MSQKNSSKQSKKAKTKALDQTTNPDQPIKGSLGSYWVNQRKNGKWRVLFQNYYKGKKQKAIQISEDMYPEMGLKTEMKVEAAKKQITKYNKYRKTKKGIEHSQIKAHKRLQEIIDFDKTLFPPVLVKEFID